MPEPPGLVVKNGTNRLPVFERPGPFVLDPQLHGRRRRARQPLPADPHAAAGLPHRIDGVAEQVDQQLLELIAVALDRQPRAAGDLDVVPLLERDDAIDDRADVERRELRRRQLGEPRVGAHEPAERLRARADHAEAALHVVAPVGRRRLALDDRRRGCRRST